MNDKIQIPNGHIAEVADYKEQVIDEYKWNPLIEALPCILTKEEAIEKLINYPPFDENERLLDCHIRCHIIQRLFQYFQPLSIHIDLEARISRMIRQGYIGRNPFDKAFNSRFIEGYDAIINKDIKLINNKTYSTTANGMTIIGVSGMGKSVSINKILSLYPQVIVHSIYRNMMFNQYQVSWLKIDCPSNGSVKGLCIDFLIKIDSILGTDFYKKTMKGNSSANTMLPVICQVSSRCSLGLLVIDEIQHLSLAKSGGAEFMLNFFVTLINNIGVPVILIGTNKAMTILQSQFRQARRGSGQGDLIFDRIKSKDDASWDLFTDVLFQYQWIRRPTKRNTILSEVLYEESQGILDVAVKLFVMAQIRAIAINKEEITPNLIRYIAKENLKLLRPMLEAIKSGNLSRLSQYEDINPIEIDCFIEQSINQINFDHKIKELQNLRKHNDSSTNRIKEEAIIKLMELDIEPKIAKKYVEMVISSNIKYERTMDVVKEAYLLIIEDENKNSITKINKKQKLEYKQDDIRLLIQQGKKDGVSAYEVLKQHGYIKVLTDGFIKVGI